MRILGSFELYIPPIMRATLAIGTRIIASHRGG
jgi:hypothetical protein